jgi:hypothetical protein
MKINFFVGFDLGGGSYLTFVGPDESYPGNGNFRRPRSRRKLA